jgi:hypothetical protein
LQFISTSIEEAGAGWRFRPGAANHRMPGVRFDQGQIGPAAISLPPQDGRKSL